MVSQHPNKSRQALASGSPINTPNSAADPDQLRHSLCDVD